MKFPKYRMKFPKYRVSQWADTSPAAMAMTSIPIVYGIQTQRVAGGLWMNVAKGTEPMFFDSLQKASAACDELRSANAARLAPVEA